MWIIEYLFCTMSTYTSLEAKPILGSIKLLTSSKRRKIAHLHYYVQCACACVIVNECRCAHDMTGNRCMCVCVHYLSGYRTSSTAEP